MIFFCKLLNCCDTKTMAVQDMTPSVFKFFANTFSLSKTRSCFVFS